MINNRFIVICFVFVFYAVLEKWVHLRTSPLFLSNLPVFQRHLSVIRHECTTEMLSIAQMSTSAFDPLAFVAQILSKYYRLDIIARICPYNPKRTIERH